MEQLDLIDILTIFSFVLQVQNQSSIISMSDIQEEIGKAVKDIHNHLAAQDIKIEKLLKEASK